MSNALVLVGIVELGRHLGITPGAVKTVMRNIGLPPAYISDSGRVQKWLMADVEKRFKHELNSLPKETEKAKAPPLIPKTVSIAITQDQDKFLEKVALERDIKVHAVLREALMGAISDLMLEEATRPLVNGSANGLGQ